MKTRRGKLGGLYSIVHELGAGAVGKVVLVEDDNGQRLAAKILSKQLVHREATHLITHFKSEFSILRKFSHPGINKVYDFGFDENLRRYYFTSEYIDGEHFLDRAKDLSVSQIEELFVQMLRALEYLHANGILHCDIKSTNALVTKNEDGSFRARLIDFGLAALGSSGAIGIRGTPAYMAPEIILKIAPDRRADLYSLGVLIYSALAKFNPFSSKDMNEGFKRQLHIHPDAPSKHNPTVPPYLDAVILKLLCKKPGDRFGTAAHVIKAINLGTGKAYAVETMETFLGYLPAGGNLVGRGEELRKISGLVDTVKDGRESEAFILCIEGEEGLGKRRLLGELKFLAQLSEMEALELKSADQITLSSFNRRLSKIDPTRPAVISCHIFGSLAVSSGRDAVHTVEALRKLAGRIRTLITFAKAKTPARIILAFSALPDEVPLFMHLLEVREQNIARICLKKFSKEEVAEYIGVLTGGEAPPRKFVDGIFELTHGNPGLITEIVRAMAMDGMLFDKFGRWSAKFIEDIGVHLEQLKPPRSINEALMRKYRGAAPDGQRLMEVMAIWHRPATLDELTNVLKSEDTYHCLISLIGAGIIEFNPEGAFYSFTSPMMGEVIYAALSDEKKHAVHESIASFLNTSTAPKPADISEILWHRGRTANTKTAVAALIELGKIHLKVMHGFEAVSTFSLAAERVQRPMPLPM